MSSIISPTAVARTVGVGTEFVDLRGGNLAALPIRVALIGQGTESAVYTETPFSVTSAAEVGAVVGYGSELHLAALGLLPETGDGIGGVPLTVYPLAKAAGAVAAAGSITPTGTTTKAASFVVNVGGVRSQQINAASGTTVASLIASMIAAINAIPACPVTAADGTTKVNLTCKWNSETGNSIKIAVEGPTDAGVSFALVQPTGGVGVANVDTATALFGENWETFVLNTGLYSTTATLDKLSTTNEGRWDAEVHRPFVAFVGYTGTSYSTATAITNARKLDRTNAFLVAPGTKDFPAYVAARELAMIVKKVQADPAQDYGSTPVLGITAGDATVQWDKDAREAAVIAGTSTIRVKNSGTVYLSDTVTCYHPDGITFPGYKFVCDLMKVFLVTHNLAIRFESENWDGKPLIPDSQATVNPNARKGSGAKGEINAMIDKLALDAVISDPDFAKDNTIAQISSVNPKRLDVSMTYKLSGNTNIIAITQNFGFYFGGKA